MIARIFYTSLIALARNPYYLKAYTFAANHNLGSYVPPEYNKIRTTLLEQEKKHVERSLEPIKSTWSAKGVSIVSDGWSDPQRRPLINFMVYCESGLMFIKIVNCDGEVKDKDFIAKLLEEVIDEVGIRMLFKSLQIMLARNCKAAGEIIEEYSCGKNVNKNKETYAQCNWITKIHNEVIQIKNFLTNHGMRLSIYMRFAPLKLLSVADTRFASIIIMLKRFKLVKCALDSMVVCDQWSAYREDDQAKARFARDKILSEEWWSKVDYILAFTNPIYDMIRICDTDKPCLYLVYEIWDVMIETVKKAIYDHEQIDDSSFFDVVHTILVDHWANNNTPLHCLAHSLKHRYYRHEWLQEHTKRLPPHSDVEISTKRKKCFRRLFPNVEDFSKAINEYARFSLGGGSFGDSDAIQVKYSIDPRNWWANFGSTTSLIQGIALRLFGHPNLSSYCERNWSTYVLHLL